MENNETYVNSNNNDQSFDREEWIRQKRDERDAAFHMVDEMLDSVKSSEDTLRTYLDVQSKFPKYSVSNALLIAKQRPDATRLGDYKYWKEAGSYINKGEAGIVILEPGKEYTRKDGSVGVNYNSKKLFDISQTNAEQKTKPEANRDGRLLMKALIFNAPCEVRVDEELKVQRNAIAFYDPSDRTIHVAKGYSYEELFPLVARELAHAHMDKENYERSTGENIAYCVAYMLCKRNGLDVSGFRFDNVQRSFQDRDNKSVKQELGKIRDVSYNITMDMNRLYEKQKEAKGRDDAR